jgi:beta-galactosidase
MARNHCGYTSFEVDITDVVRFDDVNVVAVYVDASDHEGWWYEGAGIYRHVWLIKTELVSVDLWGVWVNPQNTGAGKLGCSHRNHTA